MLHIAQNEQELADGFLEDAEKFKGDAEFGSIIINDYLSDEIYFREDEGVNEEDFDEELASGDKKESNDNASAPTDFLDDDFDELYNQIDDKDEDDDDDEDWARLERVILQRQQ